MRDFTLKTYRKLLEALLAAGFQFQTFEDYIDNPKEGKTVVLRHDVDEKARNALAMAKIEHELGVRATYFFRIVKQSNVPEVMRDIVSMGHELGYHYEDLASENGDMDRAIASFEKNLAYFRQYYSVRSVCMHGSSTSKFDNRTIWEHHQLSDYGLIGEPYLSIDFEHVFYITDIGLSWDGGRYAVRDVVVNNFGLQMHTTKQIIDTINKGRFPKHAMILAHTLWTDNHPKWCIYHLREFLRNRIKIIARNNRFVALIYNNIVKNYWK